MEMCGHPNHKLRTAGVVGKAQCDCGVVIDCPHPYYGLRSIQTDIIGGDYKECVTCHQIIRSAVPVFAFRSAASP